jgi:hypothetical protein
MKKLIFTRINKLKAHNGLTHGSGKEMVDTYDQGQEQIAAKR